MQEKKTKLQKKIETLSIKCELNPNCTNHM
jgi:hypothetical protein